MKNRIIKFEGIRNFRDIGGYHSGDGRVVRWNTLYRSGDLNEATDKDIKKISKLGIRTVIDFRSSTVLELRDLTEPSCIYGLIDLNLVSLPMLTKEMIILLKQWKIAREGAVNHNINGEQLTIDVYRSMVRECGPQVKKTIETLSNPENLPAILHCSVGKDRSGFVVALLLSALGVFYRDVVTDYLLTNRCIKIWLEEFIASHNNAAVSRGILEARTVYLNMAYNEIRKLHGPLNAYMVNVLGLNKAKIKVLQNVLLV